MYKYLAAAFLFFLTLSSNAQSRPGWAVKLDSLSHEHDLYKKKYLIYAITKDLRAYWENNSMEDIQRLSDQLAAYRYNDSLAVLAFGAEVQKGILQLEWLVKDKMTGPENTWHFSAEIELKGGRDSAPLTIEKLTGQNSRVTGITISGRGGGTLNICDLYAKCLFERLYIQPTDAEKDSLNTILKERLMVLWNAPDRFESPLPGLDRMSTLLSDDKKVKLCTYGVEKSRYRNDFYGALITKTGHTVQVHELVDESESVRSPERAVLTDTKWFGALYAELVQTNYKNKTYYTLLGYKGKDEFIKTRIVDILSLQGGRIKFGAPVFKVGGRTYNRLVFRYSGQASMLLHYDSKMKMIVMDNLAPSEPFYKGVYRFYGPDFSYNGLKFTKGVWELNQEIDLRNPKSVP